MLARPLFSTFCSRSTQRWLWTRASVGAAQRCFSSASEDPVQADRRDAPLETTTSLSTAEAELVVIGSGQMGTGIALTAARYVTSMRVTVLDISEAQLRRGQKFSELWVQKEVAKGKLEQPAAESMLQRLAFSLLRPEALIKRDMAAVPEAVQRTTFCIESASENLAVKRSLFNFLDAAAPPSAILATNTSSISITKIASATLRPQKVIGMHFMNPVPVMPLVEIISGLDTDEHTKQRTEQLASQMRKTTAHSQDRPGFVANRLLMPYLNEAVFALQVSLQQSVVDFLKNLSLLAFYRTRLYPLFLEGISSAQDIDRIMRLGANMPMGPLELADFIGLDTCLAILRVLHAELGDSKYRPAPLLTQYVDAGYLGRKSGRGFYEYHSGSTYAKDQ
ncbi:hypothetical protein ACSSS7_002516 [Eimeria intestinalis]